MAEFIEREKALEECDWYANEFCECEYAIMPLKVALEILPAADVRPVEKCKWENLVRCGFASVEATCSTCGKTLIYKSWWHFCPNCGAQVEREQEDK